MSVTQWMSWEGGVDLVATTFPGSEQPNIIVHVARLVHTPVGSAASGMVFFQPDPEGAPQFMGFISTDPVVGAYFGPNIFAGTPFEQAPVLTAEIQVTTALPDAVGVRVRIDGFEIESRLDQLGPLQSINRAIGDPLPFSQQGLEAAADGIQLRINGEPVALFPVSVGLSGGPCAVWSPSGTYAR